MFEHIAIIPNAGKIEREKIQEKLCELFSFLIRNEYYIFTVKINPGLRQYYSLKKKAFLSTYSYLMFYCSTQSELSDFLNYSLEKIPWHSTRLQFWIGKAEATRLILNRHNNKKIHVKEFFDNSLVDYLESKIVGAIDPLDDEMNISASKELKEVEGFCEVLNKISKG